MSQTTEADSAKKKHIKILLDGDPLVVPDKEITPNEILQLAGLDPATHYLVRVKGRHQDSFQGKGDESIRVHDGEVFVSLSTEPTPTS